MVCYGGANSKGCKVYAPYCPHLISYHFNFILSLPSCLLPSSWRGLPCFSMFHSTWECLRKLEVFSSNDDSKDNCDLVDYQIKAPLIMIHYMYIC